MFFFMLFTLIPASFANVGTNPAKLLHIGTVTGHRLRRKGANIGAFPIQPDTLFHPRKVIFFQAGIITVIACQHTLYAFINAMLKLLMGHEFYLLIWNFVPFMFYPNELIWYTTNEFFLNQALPLYKRQHLWSRPWTMHSIRPMTIRASSPS